MTHLTEAQWQSQVVDVARRYGWKAFHWPDSRRATDRGWPDLTLLKAPRLIAAELKTTTGRLSKDQRAVLAALAESGIEVAVWRPGDLPEIVRTLGPTGARAVYL